MISKYVLAGSPGSGKTKSIEFLQKKLPEMGYKVYAVQETATELIKSGVDRKDPQFPYYNFSLMLYRELLFEKIARENKENAIILCDRGRMDAKAYRGEAVFEQILQKSNVASEREVLASYDGVLFLQSTADGLPNEYLMDDIRIESPDQAVQLQNKLMKVWQAHPNFMFIKNTERFNEKLETIQQSILQLVNEKANRGFSTQKLIEYAEGLQIPDESMFRIVEKILFDKNIIDRNSSFEH